MGSECPLKYCFSNLAAMVFPDHIPQTEKCLVQKKGLERTEMRALG